MKDETNFHESVERDDKVELGSNRAFGIVFALVFTLIAIWPLFSGNLPRLWAIGTASIFLLISLFFPPLLQPLNVLWFRFGLLLHRFMNPLILGFLFVTTIIPIGVLLRLFGNDPLKKKFDDSSATYWISRNPAEPKPDTMKNQF